MKEVIKVSIAGVSFTVEKEAYREVENYLSELKKYYKSEAGADEIIEDIEERIAELFIERGGKDRIVTFSDVNAVIDILGRPFLSQDATGIDVNPKKRLFRDTDNAIIGGVCSGFAAYLNMDPVWIRIIYILIFFVLASPMYFIRNYIGLGGMGGFSSAALVYFILWVIIPAAKTVSQKCAMRGVSPGVEEIRNRVKEGVGNISSEINNLNNRSCSGNFFSTIGKALSFFIGFILFLISVSGLVSGFVAFIGAKWFDNISAIGALDYINIDVNVVWFKILAICCFFLPFIGMLYASIKLMVRFKAPKWRPGLIIFLFWILSLFAFVAVCFIGLKPYYNSYREKDEMVFNKDYDTLYVDYNAVQTNAKMRLYADADSDDLSLMYLVKAGDNYEYVTYPKLRIIKDKEITSPKLVYSHKYYTGMSAFSDDELFMQKDKIVNLSDSLMTINPVIYSKQNKYKGESGYIRLYVPQNTKVICVNPFNHVFDKGNKYRTSYNKQWWFNY